MKPLLLLLVFGIVPLHGFEALDCANGVKQGMTVKVSSMRTDICDAETGKLELFECHVPHTIKGNVDVEQIEDGYKQVERCEADGEKDIHFTSRIVELNETEAEPTKVPGHCSLGTMKWLPNMQWDDGEFVKRCNPDLFEVEIIACRSHSGVFVPYDNAEGQRVHEFAECLSIEGGVELTRSFGLVKNTTEAVVPTCENNKKLNETWEERDYVKACELFNDEPAITIKACIYYNVTIPVGEKNATKVPHGTAWCKRVDDPPLPAGANPSQYPVRIAIVGGLGDVVEFDYTKEKCDNGRKYNQTWIEKSIEYLCTFEDGVMKVKVLSCMYQGGLRTNRLAKNVMLDRKLPLGQSIVVANTNVTCKPTEDGKAELVRADIVIKCWNGKAVAEEWREEDFLKACFLDTRTKIFRHLPVVIVKACFVNDTKIPVGEDRELPNGRCHCTRKGRNGLPSKSKSTKFVFAAMIQCIDRPELNTMPPASEEPSTVPPTSEEPATENPTTVDPITETPAREEPATETPANEEPITKKPKTKKPSTTTEPSAPEPTCENGLKIGQQKATNGVVRVCTKDLVLLAAFCEVKNYDQRIAIGDTVRVNGTQYGCEKLGDADAKLVTKTFSQLCEEGDLTVDAWISEGVLRDCERTGEKPVVHARMCFIRGSLVEIGQDLVEEFITYKCQSKNGVDAEVIRDKSRVHKDFGKKGFCMNGKKVGKLWTEKSVRRACHYKKGNPPFIHDLGCVLPDSSPPKVIPIGSKATWKEQHLHCVEGKRGLAALAKFGEDAKIEVHRSCAVDSNGRFEGESWEDRNVLRTCKEVQDKLAVVALNCFIGNGTMQIGENRQLSEVSSIECVRVGESDAEAKIDIVHLNKVCENGRKLNEEWTDGDARKTCRIRNKRATVVVLGCVLEDGRIFQVGQRETKTVVHPGYEEYITTHCVDNGTENDAKLYKTKIKSDEKQDPRSPCGKNKHEAIWAKERFLKKCKVIDGNVLSGVTIGCVTMKETKMLEGEVVDEDDYHIHCHKNDDGNFELRYSFKIVEEPAPYHNHPH